MQNHVKLPCGLRTGSGPTFNSRGTLVTCADIFCDNEPTHVMEHITFEGVVSRQPAYCLDYLEKRIGPHVEVEAESERALRRGVSNYMPSRVSDKYWRYRDFTEQEAAEIAAIKAGKLVETYMDAPGVFEWHPPRSRR